MFSFLPVMQLAVKYSCFQNVGELANIVLDLVLSCFSGDAWTLGMLDLSFTTWLKVASPGALQGLQLGTPVWITREAACGGRAGTAETGHPDCDKHQHGWGTCPF